MLTEAKAIVVQICFIKKVQQGRVDFNDKIFRNKPCTAFIIKVFFLLT